MPNEPLFGFAYEDPEQDQPGVSVHGGVPPQGPGILALQVAAALSARVSEIAALDVRLIAVETAVAASRWRHITEGSQSGGTDFTLAVPAGYKMLRMNVWGDVSTTADIGIQINGSGTNIHIWGFLGWDSNGANDIANHSAAGTNAWRVASWSSVESNNSRIEIFPTDGSANPSYLASAHRDSTDPSAHQQQFGFGKFQADAVVSSIRVLATAGAWQTVSWVLEGYLA